FGCLLFLPIPDLRAAGAFLCAGTIAALLLTLTFVPACVALVPGGNLEGAPPGQAAVPTRSSRVALLAAAVASLAVGLGAFHLRSGDDRTRWLRTSDPARLAEDRFDAQTSGVQFDYLTIEGGEEDGMKDPALLQYIEQVQRELEKSPIVRATTGLPDVVKKIR